LALERFNRGDQAVKLAQLLEEVARQAPYQFRRPRQ
jgi:hypothetical protein